MSEPTLDDTQYFLDNKVFGAIRVSIGVVGLISLVTGLLIVIWPARVASVGTALLAIYALVTGIVYASIALFSKDRSNTSKVFFGMLGLLFIGGAIVAFMNLGGATAVIGSLLAICIGVLWMLEGLTTLLTLKSAPTRTLAMLYAVVSIIAGVVLVTSPLWAITFLWTLFGIMLIVVGVMQLVRAFGFGR